MTIKWGLPQADRPLVTAIVERAHDLGHVATKNRTNLTMDLTACHLNGTPLDFARLLAFPEFDFARRKRADYTIDGDPLSNFFRTAEIMQAKGYADWTALTSVEYAIAIKEARIEALRLNGRLDQTQNESVRDTLLDSAVYQVLALAVYDRLNEPKDD